MVPGIVTSSVQYMKVIEELKGLLGTVACLDCADEFVPSPEQREILARFKFAPVICGRCEARQEALRGWRAERD